MSNTKIYNKLLTCLLVFTLFSACTVNASLLITPTRIDFENRDRAARVSLVNTSLTTKTYKIFWREQKQTEDGRYEPLTEADKDFPSASSMIRYSPRQVTLKPNERQHIRLALRKPKSLEDGEYRSHLVFEAQPDRESEEQEKQNAAGVKIYINLAFAIPVIVRQGDLAVETQLNKVALLTKKIDNTVHTGANIEINNLGSSSMVGSLKVFWQTAGSSSEKQIGILNNVALYPEISKRIIPIGFTDHQAGNGVIRIEYTGTEHFKGTTFINHKLKVKSTDFKPE